MDENSSCWITLCAQQTLRNAQIPLTLAAAALVGGGNVHVFAVLGDSAAGQLDALSL